jgi:hypothetical protein
MAVQNDVGLTKLAIKYGIIDSGALQQEALQKEPLQNDSSATRTIA